MEENTPSQNNVPTTPPLPPLEPVRQAEPEPAVTPPPAEPPKTPNYLEDKEGSVQNLAGVPQELLELFEHDPSEAILYQTTRHPIGVVGIYLGTLIAVFAVISSFMLLVTDGFLGNSFTALGLLVTVLLVSLILGVGAVAAHVYKKSRFILTNQKVVIIKYHSLIHRLVSQLSINEVEDVNVAQSSLIDRIFKIGRVTVESSGEQNNYFLTQVQYPYDFAKRTIQAHEGSTAEYGN